MKKDVISINKWKIIITLIVVLFIAATAFLLKSNQRTKLAEVSEEWVQFSSDLLGFSTEIPNTWQVNEFPQKNTIILGSNIHIYGKYKENEDDFYIVFVKKIQLEENETLEDLFFPKERYGEDRNNLFQRENIGEYTIYTTYALEKSENMISIFLTRDSRDYLRYSLAHYVKDKPTNPQELVIERLNRIVKSTRLF